MAHELRNLSLPRSAVRMLAACAALGSLCPELGLGDEDHIRLDADHAGDPLLHQRVIVDCQDANRASARRGRHVEPVEPERYHCCPYEGAPPRRHGRQFTRIILAPPRLKWREGPL